MLNAMTTNPRRWMSFAVICAALVLAGCEGTKSEANNTPHTKAIRVRVVQLRPEPLKDCLTLLGATEPETDVRVSSESAGTVVWIGVKEGDHVDEKSVIARIDTASSGARFDRAKAARKLAEEKLRRRRELLRKGVLAQEEFDRIETELARSEASLKEMRVGVRHGVVRAPISGIVNVKNIDKGERVTEGAYMFEIVDLSRVRITVKVSETNIPHIHKNSRVSVRIDAIPGRVWDGKVEFVSCKADETVKTFKVKVILDNPDGVIRAGMLARVRFLRRSIRNALLVPLHSIITQGGERLVYVEENGIARMRVVRVGAVEGDRVQVVNGLKSGDNLVISGHTMVEDGMEVTVQ